MELVYASTRDAQERVTASQAILRGLANDGGLFVPTQIPALDVPMEELGKMSYQETAYEVMKRFLTDFTEEELKHCINSAYDSKFDTEEIAPLAKADGMYFLELFHGKTIAFKDMALQMLPHLLTASLKKCGEQRGVCILVATSGDTGKAALEGFADVRGTKILVFYPRDGVSDVQRLQMVTQTGENVGVCAVEGNFDDAQTGVKRIFGDRELAERLSAKGWFLSSANSINWGRLLPQIVYYFSAYCDFVNSGRIKCGERVNFCVPTGNFGNILAAYYAREMGVPIDRLICASNSNNVLTDFIRTGRYDRNRAFHNTISPSMDILISSNLERLLLALTQDDEQVKDYMAQLSATGTYQVSDRVREKLQKRFAGYFCDDAETKAVIGRIYQKYDYLIDPHTAVAFRVAETRRTDAPMVVLSTASPFKFPRDVLTALGGEAPASDFAAMAALTAETGAEAPASLRELDKLEVRFKTVLQPADIRTAALR